MGLIFTTIQHKFRKANKLTCNEYVLADMIYKLSTSPLSKIKGWCYMSRPNMAEEMGVSKQSILNLIEVLIEKGFIKKDEKTSYLKTTRAWDIVYFTDGTGKESLPHKSKESLPETGKESLPDNNTFDNTSLIDIKESCCFDDFWKLYGKNVGKKPCQKIWSKIKLPIRKIIFERLPKWKLQFTNNQFYPNPETFLQDERWNDDILMEENSNNQQENVLSKITDTPSDILFNQLSGENKRIVKEKWLNLGHKYVNTGSVSYCGWYLNNGTKITPR